jgi:hypothetical protein
MKLLKYEAGEKLMLLTMMILGSSLMLMSRYRIWLVFAAGGVVFTAAIWAMMQLVVQILPDELTVLAGVLSFLIVTGFIFSLVSEPETLPVR